MNKWYRSAAMAAFVVSLPHQSANADEAIPDNTIIVTATRTAQTADDALASVTVITREDIERRQAKSVDDVLRGEPGISISNNGGRGKATSFFLRGTESDHILVLVDGIKLGSATLGTTSLQDIPADQIERIEIVRGPRSSLYGSEAIGGVVQIFTRKGGGPLKIFAHAGGGSMNTYDGGIGLSGGGERSSFNISTSATGTKGFNACDGTMSTGCFTATPVESDEDSYRNHSSSARWGYRFGNNGDIDLHWLQTRSFSEFDGGFINESDSLQNVIGGKIVLPRFGNWQATLVAGKSRDENDNFLNGTFVADYETRRTNASFQNDYLLGDAHLISVGLDLQNDRVFSDTTNYPVTSRDNNGLFTQYQGRFDKQDILLSLRRDDNEQFGKQTTGNAAWGMDFAQRLRVTLSYGTAFKAPTFNELYFPFFGNPNLKPEESKTAEIGLSGKLDSGRWSVHLYETHVDELIGFDASFSPVNIDAARMRGLEAVLDWRLAEWTLNTNLGLLDPRNDSDDTNQGNLLPRRAQRTLRVMVDREVGSCRFGVTIYGESYRYDDQANTVRLGGYATTDLRGEYAFDKTWSLLGHVENLFDKQYETARLYNQPPRGLYLTLRYQP